MWMEGFFSNLPASCIRDQCRFLIGVNVNRNDQEENIQGFKAIAERTFRLVFAKNVEESLTLCDFIIDPPQTRLYNTFDFGKADEIYKIGFDETEQTNSLNLPILSIWMVLFGKENCDRIIVSFEVIGFVYKKQLIFVPQS